MSLIHFEQRMSDYPEIPEPAPSDFTRAYDSVWDILTNYVQPNSDLSLDDAVDQVSQVWDGMWLADPARTAKRLIESEFSMMPLYVADQIPYDHPSHKKLIEFVVEFVSRGKWLAGVTDEQERALATSYFWDEFSHRMKEDGEWLDPEQLFNNNHDPLRYANCCAFTAMFIFPSDQQFHYTLASWALRDAIRDPRRVHVTGVMDVNDAWVIGGAQFIIHQAPTILDRALKSHHRLMTSRSQHAERKEAMNCFSRWRARKSQPPHWDPEEQNFFLKDWKDWKDAFRAAATNEELYSKTCRDIAQNAADLMALQEKIRQDEFPQEL